MTGFIGVGQLRYILTNLGEKMSDDEVDELLKAVDTGSGEVNYTGMFISFDDSSKKRDDKPTVCADMAKIQSLYGRFSQTRSPISFVIQLRMRSRGGRRMIFNCRT